MQKKKFLIIFIIILIIIAGLFSCEAFIKDKNQIDSVDDAGNNTYNEEISSTKVDENTGDSNVESDVNISDASTEETKDNTTTTDKTSQNKVDETNKTNKTTQNDVVEKSENNTNSAESTQDTSEKDEDAKDSLKEEKVDEAMVTIKDPVYSVSRIYWVKANGIYLWTGTTYSEQQDFLDSLSNDVFAISTYGSCGPASLPESERKKYISSYNVYTMAESEYMNSDWLLDPDYEVIYN